MTDDSYRADITFVRACWGFDVVRDGARYVARRHNKRPYFWLTADTIEAAIERGNHAMETFLVFTLGTELWKRDVTEKLASIALPYGGPVQAFEGNRADRRKLASQWRRGERLG